MPEEPLPGQVVGRAIRTLRANRGWSQEAAARRLQLVGLAWERYQLGDLESGRRQDVTLTELLLLAETFGVRIADLIPEAGFVQLGKTERPKRVVHGMLAGELAPNSDLFGPTDIPGFGEGPYWTRPGDGHGLIFSDTEVDLARWAGVDVAIFHDLAVGLGIDSSRLARGVLSDVEFERLATGLGTLAADVKITPAQIKRRLAA